MYAKITENLYLVHNAKEFDDLIDAHCPSAQLIKPEGYVPDELELLYPTRIQLMADYPVLVVFDPIVDGDAWTGFKWDIVPIGKVIGGLGDIKQLNMHKDFDGFISACKSCVPFNQPRILLTGITISQRKNTQPIGLIAHVHRTHNPDLMAAIARMGEHSAKLKTLRIVFGDGKFHGSIEQHDEMMFVTQIRDITDLIANVRMNPETGKFDADYIFNHYDFFNTVPELAGYKDMMKWEVAVSTSIQSTFDAGQKD